MKTAHRRRAAHRRAWRRHLRSTATRRAMRQARAVTACSTPTKSHRVAVEVLTTPTGSRALDLAGQRLEEGKGHPDLVKVHNETRLELHSSVVSSVSPLVRAHQRTARSMFPTLRWGP